MTADQETVDHNSHPKEHDFEHHIDEEGLPKTLTPKESNHHSILICHHHQHQKYLLFHYHQMD